MEIEGGELEKCKHLFAKEQIPESTLGVKGMSGDDVLFHLRAGFLPPEISPLERIQRRQYFHYFEPTETGLQMARGYARVRGIQSRVQNEVPNIEVGEQDIYEGVIPDDISDDERQTLQDIYETTGGMLVCLDNHTIGEIDCEIYPDPEADPSDEMMLDAKVLVSKDGKFPLSIISAVIPLGNYEREMVSRELGM